ncbi:MAG: AEC family transporter [Oscillospiraceae bacterium]|nr:AEC family transporter [Oscillospiraceae bacterium]
MLDSIIFSVNAVFPLVIMMILGFCLKQRKTGLFKNPKEFFSEIDKFVFHVALPTYIFSELYGAEVGDIFNINLVIYCMSGLLLAFFILILTAPVFIKKRASRGAFIQGVCRPNFALLGVPLAGNLFGDSGLKTAALILPFALPLFNALAVIILAVNSDDNHNSKKRETVRRIILGIVKNPLIIALFLAVPFMLLKISFPFAIQKSIGYVAGTAAPLALISLGAGVEFEVLKGKIKLSLVASLLKTAVCPAVFVVPAVLLGFRDAALVVIFVLFAAPTAVGSYIMAKNMRSDYELAGQIVAVTTIICPFTVFAGSLILKSLELI